jgi:HK97 family phage prohead protease
MDHLDFEAKFVAGDQAGTVEGYASVFGVVDRGGDVVLPGAFKATLTEWKRRDGLPPMLWQHNPSQPIGVWTELTENDKGLKVKGELILDVPLATTARALMLKGALRSLSIGYQTQKASVDKASGARQLEKIDLWEISLVTIPALPQASARVKNFNPRLLEAALKDELDLSGADAVRAIALMKKHLREGGDPPNEPATREGAAEMLMSLRKAAEALRFDALRSP